MKKQLYDEELIKVGISFCDFLIKRLYDRGIHDSTQKFCKQALKDYTILDSGASEKKKKEAYYNLMQALDTIWSIAFELSQGEDMEDDFTV